jgi:hypothetical protein
MDARQGLVRCGRCQAVFNATELLQQDPQSTPHEQSVQPEPDLQVSIEIVPAVQVEPSFDFGKPSIQEQLRNPVPIAPITQAQKITFTEIPLEPDQKYFNNKAKWLWLAGSLLLCAVLLGQAVYYFRVELAATQPGLKPLLVSYCRLLQCTVPLPRKAELMSIESSELEADPAHANLISVNTLLRNHALYSQAYPDIELTLTDAQDKPLARRTLHPADYLHSGGDEMQGMAGNRELSVKLNLEIADLKPSGYRLFLFY